jgi:hypothetical protein
VGAIALALACTRTEPPAPPGDPLSPLRAFENERRKATRFAETPVQDRAFGADPYDLVALADGRIAGILRGRDAVVLLDRELHEVARAPAPRAPSGIAMLDGDVIVSSEIEPVLARYRVMKSLERLPDIALWDVYGARDIAATKNTVYLVEEHDDRLVTLRFTAKGIERSEQRVPRGPIRVATAKGAVFVASLLEHAMTVQPGGAQLKIDGPFWGLAAREVDDGALVVASGVEDHPLDRRGGFFGYVDSFVYVLRWNEKKNELRKVAAIDVGEHGLVVPKAIAFAKDGSALVTSYGSAKAVRLSWSDLDAPPSVTPLTAPPGASAIAPLENGFVAADPLLDAWVSLAGETRVIRAEPPGIDTRDERERLGEALFFTELMAPHASAEGPKSRFSCETCHFEGYVDGRVHFTGRGDIHASTKPLVGLFNNRPHFSRALDPDLSAVAENEFRVAGAPSPADPHFDLEVRDAPWLRDLGLTEGKRDAAELRLSLMAFLMSWTHRTNPRAKAARSFSADERRGAELFRDRCERCHEARTSSDDATSRVPFDRWEALVLGTGPIVWANATYEKTGIVPYVHERGARVPSLRRVYKKRPYFTNGSAPDIMSVLRRARFGGASFQHDAAVGDALDEASARAIAAFIDLL